MKRQKNDSIQSRVYCFGCVPARIAPVLNQEGAINQMWLANRLWNVLARIERYRTDSYREIMRDEQQDRVNALKLEIDGMRQAIRDARKQSRSRKTDEIESMIAAIAGQKTELRTILEKLKESSKERHDERKALLDQNMATAHKRTLRGRHAAANLGLFWCNVDDICQRADVARKSGALRFHGFRGEGTITARVKGGAGVPQCIGGNHSFFQIDAPSADGQKWRYARIRIGTNENRPVWTEVPIVLHRGIPAYADIRSASLTRRFVANKERWQLNIVVSVPKPISRRSERAIAIDVGWRLLRGNTVRVAYWSDSRRHGEVFIPAGTIEQCEQVRHLKSICDQMRDTFLPSFAKWTAEHASQTFRDRSETLSQWRSNDRLAKLIRWWADNRFAGDEEAFRSARAWRKQYLHLSDWWRNLSDQITRHTLYEYRQFSKWVVSNYDRVLIEEFDISKVAKKPSSEDSAVERDTSRYRQIAAPSVLRSAIINACVREGVSVEKMDSAYTTRCCHIDGELSLEPAAESVFLKYACGHVHDQDLNAAINLLNSSQISAALPQ
ncbi:MAG TPA: zinc ribbon domain-containing protein [Lacipirellulaceae bacterium]|nr:zinc ribbon domain-containing protein [Lacipirellulaceae bacterium]